MEEIRESLQQIQKIFEADLRAAITACCEESSPYGFALMLGEDLEMATPVVVTNSEADLPDPEDNDARYIPDEWKGWKYEYFGNFKRAYAELFKTFSETHQITTENYTYTTDAMIFMNTLYSMYLAGMKQVTPDYPDIWYWIIWISDSDRTIMEESFIALNSGRARQEAAVYFDD